jgi:murein DD-endopeptidase MepM/ murein hydrolase activator NlpD
MVEIKHGGGYTSAYAHLSKIANGLQEGARINVGEPIGAVGRSGHATGPHLHFEFSLDGQKIDFLSVKIAAADSLTGAKLQQFHQERDRLLAQLRDGTNQIVGLITQPWN